MRRYNNLHYFTSNIKVMDMITTVLCKITLYSVQFAWDIHTLKGSVHQITKNILSYLVWCPVMRIHILRTVKDNNFYRSRHWCYGFTDCYVVYSISGNGVRPSLTVIHLTSVDWSNCSASLSLFSLLDLLRPRWMRAWFGRSVCEWVYVCWRQLWDLVCVYLRHWESICMQWAFI